MTGTIDRTSILERASQLDGKDLPPADKLVEALLETEREGKKNKEMISFDRLLGTWRLQFITGTKKARGRAGIVLGAGRYVPRWLKIQIAYTRRETGENAGETGTIRNQVEFGSLKLTVSGPAKFLPRPKLLAFDFTRMTVTVFGLTLYSGFIRGGEESERQFDRAGIQKQAFFAYFYTGDRAIAARGRGGGLALWARE
ncbi:hypothetical protein V0288_14510 [Pannus brasiliensis CCIBt3594]|uniref:Plastid lipid-associated protein/fibrillin conserved domain-containing protein n=1 Tax=Pannus brasiliensis CCIBt3594 TaxID=1427578 RepID=A0AAW9QYV2_9CHRO